MKKIFAILFALTLVLCGAAYAGDTTLNDNGLTLPNSDTGNLCFNPSTSGESVWCVDPNHNSDANPNDNLELKEGASVKAYWTPGGAYSVSDDLSVGGDVTVTGSVYAPTYTRSGAGTMTIGDTGVTEMYLITDGGNLTIDGLVKSKQYIVEATTSTVTVSGANCKGALHINNTSGAVHFDLPGDPNTGLNCCFQQARSNSGKITVDPTGTNDKVHHSGTDYDPIISNGASTDKICITAQDADYWIVTDYDGTWDAD